MEPIGMEDLLKMEKKTLYINNGNFNDKFNLTDTTKRNSGKNNKDLKMFTDNQTYMYKYRQNRMEENITIEKKTERDDTYKRIIQGTEDQVKKKIENTKGIPIVMKLMLKMMLKENGHNHREFRQKVLNILQDNRYKVEDILDNSFKFKDCKYSGKYGKIKKLWARYLFDTYTMLCTKIANNFIRYDKSHPEELFFKEKESDEESTFTIEKTKKVRMHVNKLGAIDVLNDKRKITNILRDFSSGKEYLASRGNGLLGASVPLLGSSVPLLGYSVPDKVEYGMLINDLNISISKFAGQLLDWRKNGLRGSEALKTIMNEMDRELSDILKNVDTYLEMEKRSSTIRQPWNKACNLKKCGQFLYSKCKLGNNVITGQLFSGKNSRSGKLKYKPILNNCISDLKNLKDQEEEIVEKKLF